MKIVYNGLIQLGQDGTHIETGVSLKTSNVIVFKADYGNLSIVNEEEFVIDDTKLVFANKLHRYTRIIVIASEQKQSIVNLDVADFRRRYSNLTNRFVSSYVGRPDDENMVSTNYVVDSKEQTSSFLEYVYNELMDDVDISTTYTNVTIKFKATKSGELIVRLKRQFGVPLIAELKVPVLNSEIGHEITKTVSFPALKDVETGDPYAFIVEAVIPGIAMGKGLYFGNPEDVPVFKHLSSYEIHNRMGFINRPTTGNR